MRSVITSAASRLPSPCHLLTRHGVRWDLRGAGPRAASSKSSVDRGSDDVQFDIEVADPLAGNLPLSNLELGPVAIARYRCSRTCRTTKSSRRAVRAGGGAQAAPIDLGRDKGIPVPLDLVKPTRIKNSERGGRSHSEVLVAVCTWLAPRPNRSRRSSRACREPAQGQCHNPREPLPGGHNGACRQTLGGALHLSLRTA